MHACPRCGEPNVQQRQGKNGRPYLAYVETYPSGISYFRGLHTSEHCKKQTALIESRAAYSAEVEKWASEVGSLGEELRLSVESGAVSQQDAMQRYLDFLAANPQPQPPS